MLNTCPMRSSSIGKQKNEHILLLGDPPSYARKSAYRKAQSPVNCCPPRIPEIWLFVKGHNLNKLGIHAPCTNASLEVGGE